MTIIKDAPRPILGALLSEILRNECNNETFWLLVESLKKEVYDK